MTTKALCQHQPDTVCLFDECDPICRAKARGYDILDDNGLSNSLTGEGVRYANPEPPKTCTVCQQPRWWTTSTYEYCGGVGMVEENTCPDCREERRVASEKACRLLRESIKKGVMNMATGA